MVTFLTVCILILLMVISVLLALIKQVSTNKAVFESIINVYDEFIEALKSDGEVDNKTLSLSMENALKRCINSKKIDVTLVKAMLCIQYGHPQLLNEMSDADAIRNFAIMMAKTNQKHPKKGE